ncbi:MAG: pantetheine-phosphate adenylyltransferase [Tissierellia bacterium]|nr:pantetheine-phosphate adenylyltransferase [Tissierellia bacterium]
MHAIYPGSFDPVTMGHIDIILRAAAQFDELTVAVLINHNKKGLFTIEERLDLLRESLKEYPEIKIESFSGLLIDYAAKKGEPVILRGLRAISDFENEMQLALANKNSNRNIETLFMVSNPKYSFLSSSLIREIAAFQGDVSNLVPPAVEKALRLKYKEGL